MNTFKNFSFLCLFALLNTTLWAQDVNIIPYPQKVEVTQDTCPVRSFKNIYVNGFDNLEKAAYFLCDQLKALGVSMTVKEDVEGDDGISFHLYKERKKGESYQLVTTGKNVVITAADYAGAIHGVQSLLQELRSGSVKCGVIEDAPRYGWRGYLLDEARHFQGEKKVKQLLDVLSYYKINRFHWHLTDQQGWRIEIKKYPKLTEIGGVGNLTDPQAPAAFYTQEQIKDIVAYAAERAIEIIPEIDMPGHAGAANRSYPEYQSLGTDKYPDFCFNPGKKETYKYLENILSEVSRLFPFKYIHIGGDEVSYGNGNWKNDESIQALMENERLKDEREVEIYFIHRMMRSVMGMSKIAMAWDDVFDSSLRPEECVITWWRHDKKEKLVKMAKSGIPLVLCPRKPLYFDFVQHDNHKVGRRWDGFCPLEDVYAFPESKYEEWNVTEEDLQSVMGIQANLWGELVHNSERVDFMTFPRIIAMAETAWTMPENKDYVSFMKRLEDAYQYMDGRGLYYFDALETDRHQEPEGPVKK